MKRWLSGRWCMIQWAHPWLIWKRDEREYVREQKVKS